MEFMSDQLFDGWPIRILTIVDAFIESFSGPFAQFNRPEDPD